MGYDYDNAYGYRNHYEKKFDHKDDKKFDHKDDKKFDHKFDRKCDHDFCDEFKLLKVIGEKTVQIVSDTVDQLDYPAEEILKIDFELANTTDHAFTDKVVKQGFIRKKVIYCDTNGVVRCQTFEIPFTAVAEIPGVDPDKELEFQNKLVLEETDFDLICPNTLSEKVVFEIKITVSTWVHRRLKVCHSNILSHIQICH